MSILGLGHSRREESSSEAAKYDHLIQLLDNTADNDHARASSSGTSTPSSQPSKRRTRESLREDLAKRGLARQKYAKWQQDRFAPSGGEGSNSGEAIQIDSKGARIQTGEAEEVADSSSESESRFARTKSRVERGRRRVKGLLNSRKAIKHAKDEDAMVDVLYENQRGSFFFGIPLFSSKSLLNFDPAPWENGKHKPSPVNITNASVPDPSWEWAWQSWYVDMSHDVDEEGWEYSFSFQRGVAWHGTHPWFHSFVRRRRWLRKRVRKHTLYGAAGGKLDPNRLSDAHMLNADYFTIHLLKNKNIEGSAAASSLARSRSYDDISTHHEDEDIDEDIRDIPTLMRRLKKASIDREKIVTVRRFLDQGGEELHYLAEQMPAIMALLVFQSSRRQLLSLLLRRLDTAQSHRRAHEERSQPEDEAESRIIDNLVRALQAADEQVRRLEYWSDIRGMAVRGETLGAADESHGWGHGWHGVDDSGPTSVTGATEEFKEDGPGNGDATPDVEGAVERGAETGEGEDEGESEILQRGGPVRGHSDGEQEEGEGQPDRPSMADKGKGKAVR